MKKIKILITFLLIAVLVACGGDGGASSSEKEKVTLLIGKNEIVKELEAMIGDFNNSQENVEVEIIPLAGQNGYERMTALYSSGNAPTIMMMGDEFAAFQDRLLDLSNEPWIDEAYENTLEFVEVDGAYYGMPATVEAFGYIYNEDVLNEAVGGDFDPATINTQNALQELLEDVASLNGVEAINITPEDWTLGAHYTNIAFTNQSSNTEERHQFLKDLKSGDEQLAENEVFNGWLDTFDLMKEYNIARKSPLDTQYDDATINLSTGEIGLWFMGNWSYPQLFEMNPDVSYGFIPVPISNDPSDLGNNEISVGVPSYWVVDESQSTEAEQEGAKEFLNWMVSTKEGQEHYVNGLKFIPIFENMDVKPEDSLSLQVLELMEKGQTLEWMNLYYPTDAYPILGATLQKYLVNKIDRAELTEEFQSYWESK